MKWIMMGTYEIEDEFMGLDVMGYKNDYWFVEGEDEFDALVNFLKENNGFKFTKLIITPLSSCHKFCPGVDYR
jgi:hypothetical protein